MAVANDQVVQAQSRAQQAEQVAAEYAQRLLQAESIMNEALGQARIEFEKVDVYTYAKAPC